MHHMATPCFVVHVQAATWVVAGATERNAHPQTVFARARRAGARQHTSTTRLATRVQGDDQPRRRGRPPYSNTARPPVLPCRARTLIIRSDGAHGTARGVGSLDDDAELLFGARADDVGRSLVRRVHKAAVGLHAIRSDQKRPEAIRSHRKPSEAINKQYLGQLVILAGNQKESDDARLVRGRAVGPRCVEGARVGLEVGLGHRRKLLARRLRWEPSGAIRSDQERSGAIRSHQEHSQALPSTPKHSQALSPARSRKS